MIFGSMFEDGTTDFSVMLSGVEQFLSKSFLSCRLPFLCPLDRGSRLSLGCVCFNCCKKKLNIKFPIITIFKCSIQIEYY